MRPLLTFIRIFLTWTLIGVASKIIFLLTYHHLLSDTSLTDHLFVLWYGLRLDVAVAGYLTVIPALLLTVNVWFFHHTLHYLWRSVLLISSFLAVLAYVANLGLYGYWGFPLDNTPLLYITTSPADALASLTGWQLLLFPIAITLLTACIYRLFPQRPQHDRAWTTGRRGKKISMTAALLMMTAALLLPIRGGVGTGTNHTGSVYFSDNIRLNHAAVNPIFCFVEAVIHQQDIGTKYRFMDDTEATALFQQMTHTDGRTDSTVTARHYNVILITLESFSDTIVRIKGVSPCLEQLTHEGIHYDHFYANSFRTDRALVAIHSGLPAQPTMSIMDIPRKSTTLPSIARTLARNGYTTTFYYGGDINYSNMRSYFMGTGFQHIVSDVDFPTRQHTGKWGVADGPVYDRMLADIRSDKSGCPFFRSIMTSSSHEPFDVPDYRRINDNVVLNAFSYADHCLGQFIKELKKLPCWQHTIVAIVSDHLGAYPDDVDNYQLWRYQIPLILLGGPIDGNTPCHTTGCQTDIPATLLGMLGIDHSDFIYSKDIHNPDAPHFAYFTFPDAMGIVTDSSHVIYDNLSDKAILADGADTTNLVKQAKAYLQKLYDDLDQR